MPQTAQPGLPRHARVAWLCLLLPLLLVVAGLLHGTATGAQGYEPGDRPQAARTVSARSPAASTAGAATARMAAPSGVRAEAGRAQAHGPSSFPAVLSGHAARTAAATGPAPAWLPAVALLAGPPRLLGRLPRPPTPAAPRTDLVALRGRAPPGPAGT